MSSVDFFQISNNHTPIYIPDKLNRIETINLASRKCDFFVLSAAGSTFGWWMAYLLDDSKQKNVFYNSKIFRHEQKLSAENFQEDNFFPPEWHRLVLDNNTSTVYEEDRDEILLIPDQAFFRYLCV